MDRALSAIALFGFLAVVLWMRDRRQAAEDARRHELYRRMLDTPGEGAEALRDLIARDEIRREERQNDEARGGGLVGVAVGIGLTTFLYQIAPGKPVYLVGLIPMLIGAAGLLNLVITRRRRRESHPPAGHL